MVRIHPDPPERAAGAGREPIEARGAPCTKGVHEARSNKEGEAKGAVAQLGERLLCKQEVIGSIPFSSTSKEAGILEIASSSKLTGKPRGLPLIFESRVRDDFQGFPEHSSGQVRKVVSDPTFSVVL